MSVPSSASQSIHRSRRRTFCGSQRIALEFAAHTPTTPATADSTFCDGRELPVPVPVAENCLAENCLSLGLCPAENCLSLGLCPAENCLSLGLSGTSACPWDF